MAWYVYRRPKGRKNAGVQSQGKYATEKEARAAAADGRKYQKEYTWSVGSDGGSTHWSERRVF